MDLTSIINNKLHSKSPFFNVLVFSTFWAFQIFTTKLGLNTGSLILPYQFIMILVAMAIIMVLLLPSSRESFRILYQERPALFGQLFLANAIQTGLGTTLSIVGIALTDAINAGFLVKLSMVSTIGFAHLILKERLSFLKVFLMFVMLGGAYLLTTKGQRLIPRTGDFLILGACICWSLGNVLVRKILSTKSVKADVVILQKPIASITVFCGFVAIVVIAPGIFGDLQEVLRCCATSLVSLPYAIASGFCLGMTWIYLYRTLEVATASYLTMVSMITPVLVSILALMFLGETLIGIQIIGIALILSSGIMVSRSDMATS